MKRYILWLVIVTSVIALTVIALLYTDLSRFYLPIFPYLILFFFLLMLVSHYIAHGKLFRKNSFAIGTYLLASTIKFVGLLTFFLIYVLNHRNNIVPFVVVFCALYIIYTVFGVTQSMKISEKNNQR